MNREDDFEVRRQHLKGLSDGELEDRFWDLCNKIVEPLINLAEKHTSPEVERSVILRMGFSSTEAKGIVDRVTNLSLLGKGAGNVVYRLAKLQRIGIRQAGIEFSKGNFKDSDIVGLFKGGQNNG